MFSELLGLSAYESDHEEQDNEVNQNIQEQNVQENQKPNDLEKPKLGALENQNSNIIQSTEQSTIQTIIQDQNNPHVEKNRQETNQSSSTLSLFAEYSEIDEENQVSGGGVVTAPQETFSSAIHTNIIHDNLNQKTKIDVPMEKMYSQQDFNQNENYSLEVSKLPPPQNTDAISFKDIVSKLGIAGDLNENYQDILYDSDDEELADLQFHKDTEYNAIVDLEDDSNVEGKSEVHEDLSKQENIGSIMDSGLKRKLFEENNLLKSTLPPPKRARTDVPALPDILFEKGSVHATYLTNEMKKKELQNIQEETAIISQEQEDDEEDDLSEFELDESEYSIPETRSMDTIVDNNGEQSTGLDPKTSYSTQSLNELDLPHHIRQELKSTEIKEINAQDQKKSISIAQRLQYSNPIRDSERDIEKAKRYVQLTAGNLMGHEMVKLAQESLRIDSGNKPSGRKR